MVMEMLWFRGVYLLNRDGNLKVIDATATDLGYIELSRLNILNRVRKVGLKKIFYLLQKIILNIILWS